MPIEVGLWKLGDRLKKVDFTPMDSDVGWSRFCGTCVDRLARDVRRWICVNVGITRAEKTYILPHVPACRSLTSGHRIWMSRGSWAIQRSSNTPKQTLLH